MPAASASAYGTEARQQSARSRPHRPTPRRRLKHKHDRTRTMAREANPATTTTPRRATPPNQRMPVKWTRAQPGAELPMAGHRATRHVHEVPARRAARDVANATREAQAEPRGEGLPRKQCRIMHAQGSTGFVDCRASRVSARHSGSGLGRPGAVSGVYSSSC